MSPNIAVHNLVEETSSEGSVKLSGASKFMSAKHSEHSEVVPSTKCTCCADENVVCPCKVTIPKAHSINLMTWVVSPVFSVVDYLVTGYPAEMVAPS